MTEEYFYHYTNSKSSKAIFLAGKIQPSLKVNGDAVHGDGVYLTTLDPRLGKETVGGNNWDGAARRQDGKMESYFEILMPSNMVKRAKAKRDIQVHDGELRLADYKWNLRNWDGDLLATQYFMVRSEGEAAMKHNLSMGRYTLCTYIVTHDDNPVYKHDDSNRFLYSDKSGYWCISTVAGNDVPNLIQYSKNSPSPHKTKPWQFYDKEWKFDETLRVYACY
jgi:hypothetical protein